MYQWNTVEDLKCNIVKWVNWYNYKRPHQSLNFSTPAEILYEAYSSKYYLNLDEVNIVKEVEM